MGQLTIDSVVFDFGGVLIDWDPRHLYRKLMRDEAAIEGFLSRVCTTDWNHMQDEGRRWEDAVEELSGRFPEHRSMIEAYWHRWPEMMLGPFDETVSIADDLRQRGVKLYGLTNFSAETFPFARARFEFLEWFEGIVVSGEVGSAKPSPRIFRLLLERFDLDPASLVFVDDQPRNVEAARSLGIQSHRFTTATELRNHLTRLDLLDSRAAE